MSLFRCVLAAGATILGLALGFSAMADEAARPIGKDVGTLPLFDAHIHYKAPAWGPYPPAAVLELMDRNVHLLHQ